MRPLRSCRLALATSIVAAAAVMVVAGPATPARAAPIGPSPQFSAPFPCGQQFRTETFGHAPAIDVFRTPTSATPGNPVVAAATGTVNISEYEGGPGNVIQIRHPGNWYTTYIHLEAPGPPVGTVLAQGDPVGRVGKTGATSGNTYHVHFEVGNDLDNDDRATFGKVTAERVPPVLDGVTYGLSNGTSRSGVSRNSCAVGGRSYEYRDQQHVLGWSTTNKVTSYWYQPGQNWAMPELLNLPNIEGQPVGISAYDQQHVFVRSPTGSLFHYWYSPGSPWQPDDLLRTIRGKPAVCSYQTAAGEQLHVFGSTSVGKLGHWWYQPDGLGWRYDELPLGSAASGPACVAWRDQLQVFARANDATQALEHWWYTPGAAWNYGRLGGSMTGDPAATTYAPPGSDQIAVFVRSSSGVLVQWKYEAGGQWAGLNLGGEFVGTPTAGTLRNLSPPQLQVFGRTADGKLRHWWYAPGTSWKQQDEGTGVGGDPTLLVYTYPGPDQTNVFAKSSTATTLTMWAYTNGWKPENRGGSVAI